MVGFISRIQRIEERLAEVSPEQLRSWLMVINSDILSAVEKPSPVVIMRSSAQCPQAFEYTIARSERGFEGEEYLAILERAVGDVNYSAYATASEDPHMLKWRGRISYLEELDGECR